jgi:transposase
MAGTANNLAFWTELINLKGYVVVHMQEDAVHRRYCFTIRPQHGIGVCPHCGKTSDTVKQRRTRDEIADLPIGTHTVELVVRVEQFECQRCEQCFTPPLEFVAEGAHATERFLERASELIDCADVANAARFFRVPEKTLEGWYYDYLERKQHPVATASGEKIRRLGIDELSLKKDTDSTSP